MGGIRVLDLHYRAHVDRHGVLKSACCLGILMTTFSCSCKPASHEKSDTADSNPYSELRQQRLQFSSMSAHVAKLLDIASSNEALCNEIDQLAGSIQCTGNSSDAEIKNVLIKIQASLNRIGSDRGNPLTPNEVILEAWRSFFGPIQRLLKLPSGAFYAARKLLYMASAFIDGKGLDRKLHVTRSQACITSLFEFCLELDEALLASLREVWISSNRREMFNWVLTGYQMKTWIGSESPDQVTHRIQLAQALSVDELIELGGIKGLSFTFADLDDPGTWKPFLSPMPRWDLGDEYDSQILWQDLGTDGPIRRMFLYRTVADDRNEEERMWIDVLRRSRQFIFDARQIAEPAVDIQRRLILEHVLSKHRIPNEIRSMILDYLQARQPFRYLANLGIATAYAPFPRVGRSCDHCTGETNEKIKLTCPQESIYIWNLALRIFHCFHQEASDSGPVWWICKDGISCRGHHKIADWQVGDVSELISHIEVEAGKHDPTFSSLNDSGLGPKEPIRAESQRDDYERQDKLFTTLGPFEDSANDLIMIGGVGGLVDCMIHGRVLLGAWEGPTGLDPSGHSVTDSKWALGRNLVEKRIGEHAIQRLHQWSNQCEWC